MIVRDFHLNMLAISADRISRRATLDALPEIMAFIARSCRQAAVTDSTAFDLRLAVEEVCVNAIRHGGATRLEVVFTARDAWTIEIAIRDDGAAFDPAAVKPADTTSPWQQRTPGGLGWHLVARVVDRVGYERQGNDNVVTLTKSRRT